LPLLGDPLLLRLTLQHGQLALPLVLPRPLLGRELRAVPDRRDLLQLRLPLLRAVESRRRRLEIGLLPAGETVLGFAPDERLARPVAM
jgi:hypothetical protein